MSDKIYPTIEKVPPAGKNFVKVKSMSMYAASMDSAKPYKLEPADHEYVNIQQVTSFRTDDYSENATVLNFTDGKYLFIEGNEEETKKKFGIFE